MDLDLSIVKKEPCLDSICPTNSGIFDTMIREDFQDHFHSMPSEEPVDWLSSFFDEVPTCMEQNLSNYSVPEYTSSLHHSSIRTQNIGLNSLGIDPMPSLPEDCSNESMYGKSPADRSRSPDFESKVASDGDQIHDDLKPVLFNRRLSAPFESQHMFNSHMEGVDDGGCITETHSRSSVGFSSDDTETESGYDSGAHSPTCQTPSTPPRSLEIDSDMSGSSMGERTPPALQIQEKQPFFLTDEERRTLISEGLPVPSGLPLTKVEERALKKVRRKIKNKISAQESRRKKKEYMETLEKRVETCSSENLELRKKLDSLENTNRNLIGQLQKLQALISPKVQRPVNARSTQTSTCLMVVVLCFAVFVGSWSPLSRNGITLHSHAVSDKTVAKQPMDYSTPSVRSRVLLSVADDYDDVDFAPTPSIVDKMASYLAPGPTITAIDNDTHKYVAMETVPAEANERPAAASSAV
ncbi:cyclic AMP-responsive element-binding protein 3-like protein 2 isoform X2 [Nematostella vectensis]|uniref:cyclic AMP-responsive element-binding protein 3-like protein 2 isoform X2 n=1 Tax=Nematostella vectensis TaxID=45351 RepID=UPI00138FB00C|nr:cyclic AMP-responsive element-binding protein 3-like protein 2 isoform X2 [Nematostella vectensis]